MLHRPMENEYPDYYVPYVNLVPEGNLIDILEGNLEEALTLFEGINEEAAISRYAEDKWSIKEVLGHIIDTERVMSYRLLRISRGDRTPLAGFNENDYVAASGYHQLPLRSILDEFIATRKATLSMIKNMPEAAWAMKGVANGLEISTTAIAYVIAGHDTHHRNIILERYLTTAKK